jgi:2'-5' RNA ligase
MPGDGSPPADAANAPQARDAVRCFVGFELTDASRAYLRERVEALHAELGRRLEHPPRVVPPDNWHATLLFFPRLGRAERDVVWEAVTRGVSEGAWRDLRFAWQRLAVWPNPRRPGLICAEAEPYLAAAQWPLLDSLHQAPFNQADTRHAGRYVPHITVMRFRRGRHARLAPDWEALPEALRALDATRIRFDRVAFFLSTVSAQAPIYPRERTLPLAD